MFLTVLCAVFLSLCVFGIALLTNTGDSLEIPSTLDSEHIQDTDNGDFDIDELIDDEDFTPPNYEDFQVTAQAQDLWVNHRAGGFAGGDGSSWNPYLISNAEQLAYLASCVNSGNPFADKYFKLTTDINLYGHDWVAIGRTNYFSGCFNGDYHVIYNMSITNNSLYLNAENCFSGLFGYTSNAYILNVVVSGNITFENIQSYLFSGGVAGYALNTSLFNCASEISACYTGLNYKTFYIGGIVGYCYINSYYDVRIGNCANLQEIKVSGGVSDSHVGGITGKFYGFGEIGSSANYAKITVENSKYVGGIVGHLYASSISNNISLVRCFNFASISSTGSYKNGIVAWSGIYSYSVPIYKTKKVWDFWPFASHEEQYIDGYNNYYADITISDCVSTSNNIVGYKSNSSHIKENNNSKSYDPSKLPSVSSFKNISIEGKSRLIGSSDIFGFINGSISLIGTLAGIDSSTKKDFAILTWLLYSETPVVLRTTFQSVDGNSYKKGKITHSQAVEKNLFGYKYTDYVTVVDQYDEVSYYFIRSARNINLFSQVYSKNYYFYNGIWYTSNNSQLANSSTTSMSFNGTVDPNFSSQLYGGNGTQIELRYNRNIFTLTGITCYTCDYVTQVSDSDIYNTNIFKSSITQGGKVASIINTSASNNQLLTNNSVTATNTALYESTLNINIEIQNPGNYDCYELYAVYINGNGKNDFISKCTKNSETSFTLILKLSSTYLSSSASYSFKVYFLKYRQKTNLKLEYWLDNGTTVKEISDNYVKNKTLYYESITYSSENDTVQYYDRVSVYHRVNWNIVMHDNFTTDELVFRKNLNKDVDIRYITLPGGYSGTYFESDETLAICFDCEASLVSSSGNKSFNRQLGGVLSNSLGPGFGAYFEVGGAKILRPLYTDLYVKLFNIANNDIGQYSRTDDSSTLSIKFIKHMSQKKVDTTFGIYTTYESPSDNKYYVGQINSINTQYPPISTNSNKNLNLEKDEDQFKLTFRIEEDIVDGKKVLFYRISITNLYIYKEYNQDTKTYSSEYTVRKEDDYSIQKFLNLDIFGKDNSGPSNTVFRQDSYYKGYNVINGVICKTKNDKDENVYSKSLYKLLQYNSSSDNYEGINLYCFYSLRQFNTEFSLIGSDNTDGFSIYVNDSLVKSNNANSTTFVKDSYSFVMRLKAYSKIHIIVDRYVSSASSSMSVYSGIYTNASKDSSNEVLMTTADDYTFQYIDGGTDLKVKIRFNIITGTGGVETPDNKLNKTSFDSADSAYIGNTFYIDSYKKLNWMAENLIKNSAYTRGYAGCTFVQTCDIDCTGKSMLPIGYDYNPFMGVYDGQGYTIKNATYNEYSNVNFNAMSNVGIFGAVKYATIKNLKIENAEIIGGNKVGILAGQIEDSKISNVVCINSKVSVSQNDKYSKGILIELNNVVKKGNAAEMSKCTFLPNSLITEKGYVESELVTGGFVYELKDSIADVVMVANVNGGGEYVSIFAGKCDGASRLTYCVAANAGKTSEFITKYNGNVKLESSNIDSQTNVKNCYAGVDIKDPNKANHVWVDAYDKFTW